MADSEQRAASSASAPEPQTVGQILRNARAARDLTLEQISAELRIERHQLDALEQDRFERIGVTVFVKGYLRQYGARLGLDPREVIAQYDRQASLREVEIKPSKTIKLHDERQITVWVIASLVLLVLIVALAMWWLNGGGFTLGPGAATPTTVENATPAPAETPAQQQARPSSPPQPAAGAASAAAPVTAAAPSAPPTSAARAEPALRGDGPAAGAGAPESTPRAPAPTDGAPGAAQPDPAAFIVTLDLTFDQESWAEITDARGERLFYGLGAAGRRAQLRGEPPFAVVLGNSAGVRLQLDGEDYPVPTSGRPGDSSRFTVDIVEE